MSARSEMSTPYPPTLGVAGKIAGRLELFRVAFGMKLGLAAHPLEANRTRYSEGLLSFRALIRPYKWLGLTPLGKGRGGPNRFEGKKRGRPKAVKTKQTARSQSIGLATGVKNEQGEPSYHQ